ncbi:MAG: DUF4177 domain-containing protein [Anaerolineales bacterium]|nr:DUF4177 domain-containing protein [Anaerolineales bacterium]
MSETIQWEYRIESFGTFFSSPKDEDMAEILNEWGEEGWEVVHVHSYPNTSKALVIAKRPLDLSTRRRRSMPR